MTQLRGTAERLLLNLPIKSIRYCRSRKFASLSCRGRFVRSPFAVRPRPLPRAYAAGRPLELPAHARCLRQNGSKGSASEPWPAAESPAGRLRSGVPGWQ